MKNYKVKKICSINGKFCKIDDVLEAQEHEVKQYVEAYFLEEIVVMSTTSSDTTINTKEEKK